MEYAAGSSRKDPGQGHINLLPSDVVITEAPMRQFEPCHCCKMYDRPCLRSSSKEKKSEHSEVLEEYTNPRPEINWKQEKTQNVYSDFLMPPSQLPMGLKDDQVDCRTSKLGAGSIDLSGWEITCTEFSPRGRRQVRSTTDVDPAIRARTRSPVRSSMRSKKKCRCTGCQPCFKCGEYGHFIRDCRSSTWKDPPNSVSTSNNLNWTKILSGVRMSGGDSSNLLRMLAAQYEPSTQGQRSNKQCDRNKSGTWYHREGMVHTECATPKKVSKGKSVWGR